MNMTAVNMTAANTAAATRARPADRPRKLRRLLVLCLALLPLACASLEDTQPPTIHLSNVRIGTAGLFAQELFLDVRIGNPNDVDLPLAGLTFTLDINGREFATGLSNETVTVPRLGYATVSVAGTTDTLSVIRQLMTIGESDRVAFRLHGLAYVGHAGISRRVPYERIGELSLVPSGRGPGAPGVPGLPGAQNGVRTFAPVAR